LNLEKRFRADVMRNPGNTAVLKALRTLQMPDAWLVAGSLFQAVWNQQCGQPAAAGVKDYDVFYFDPDDLSPEAEARAQAQVAGAIAHAGARGLVVEVKNQARVHLWYEAWFGHPYSALQDACEGIGRFLVRSTCVGLQAQPGGELTLHAPCGLEELYAGLLRPNLPHAEPALFERKVASYQARWPWLRVQA
jgi:uncharacterized protein